LVWLISCTVIDTHPDHSHTLRIDTPFKALEDYALGLDLESMDSMEHSHVPYVLLLVRALRTFEVGQNLTANSSRVSARLILSDEARYISQNENDGKRPTYDTTDAFKEVLARERKALDEENFAEAEGQVFAVTQVSEVSRPRNFPARDFSWIPS
jgi:amyloid beta precursor protein binding protein 1